MQKVRSENSVVSLLIRPDFRIFRHLILFTFTFLIAAGFIRYIQDEGVLLTPLLKYGGLSLFIFIFLGGCYFNIYILTPRLLMKGKWVPYFLSLMAVVLFALIAIMIIQSILLDRDGRLKDLNYLLVVLNLMSSSLSVFLLFAGTTTLALFKYWILDMQQAEELESTTAQLELKLLENQINPHFLFNMLNNANIMIKKDPDIATDIIEKLEDMLRYQMNGSSLDKVKLQDEVLFLSDFLELEKTRRDDFEYIISKKGNIDDIETAPLLFITFVENAIKHNSDSRAASFVHILFEVKGHKLIFTCVNSIPKISSERETGGIGLANIKRRLNLLYNDRYSLEQTKTDTTYTVKLELKL